MNWRERTDLWYGTALVRPEPSSANAEPGGAYVSFFVGGEDNRAALTVLYAELLAQAWRPTSLLKMSCAIGFEDDENADDEFELLARQANLKDLALGAYHVFPKETQQPQ